MSESGKHRIGLVECPSCKRSGKTPSCKLCHGAGTVTVDVAIAWQVQTESSLPPPKKEE